MQFVIVGDFAVCGDEQFFDDNPGLYRLVLEFAINPVIVF
jgi:hypothetical protein